MSKIRFSETMTGSYRLLHGTSPVRPFSFTLAARARSMLRYEVEGTVEAEGLAAGRQAEGTIAISPANRTLTYRLRFSGDDGKDYILEGVKRVSLLHLARTMTTLPFDLYGDVAEHVGEGVVTIRGNDLRAFLRSFRLF